jgi:hypothetical protein
MAPDLAAAARLALGSFSGVADNVQSFCANATRFIDDELEERPYTTNRSIVQAVVGCFKGDAAAWFKHRFPPREGAPKSAELLDALRLEQDHMDGDHRAWQHLFACKQDNRSLETYIHDFYSRVDGLSGNIQWTNNNSGLTSLFRAGLTRAIEADLSKKPHPVDEPLSVVLARARGFYNAAHPSALSAAVGDVRDPPGRTCWCCGDAGHTCWRCPHLKERQSKEQWARPDMFRTDFQ